MRAIGSAIAAADVSGVLVCGPAGAGKSRIVRQAMSDAQSQGCECRWLVGATSASAIPLGACTAWMPPGVTDTAQLLRGVIASLSAASPGDKVVVCVDDAHLLDDLSAFVVHQTVQRGSVKVLLTVLDSAPIPAAVQDISKVGQFDRIDLRPLSRDETAALLSATLRGPVDPDAAQKLWMLTRGNVLYLRGIVEQEVADGRIVDRNGHWRWISDPAMPPGLVQLIESRVGSLPALVNDVVDALAVGEPIELAVLERIADPAAVEEAETRGLVTLESVAGGVHVRLAHPLYGEIRRRRAPVTRLRRFRGLVAAELAASEDCDEIGVVVRRAALSLDSDLTPDTELLVKASHGAFWLADLHLADRLAAAADRAGAGPEPSFIRAHALSWLGRGEDADAIFAAIPAGDLSEIELARLAFLRAGNMLWVLGDPARAKQLIDQAPCMTSPQARGYIDAFLTMYWFAMDQPGEALKASKNLAVEQLPAVVGAEIAWVLAVITADAGQSGEAIGLAEAGYVVATRSLDAPHMRFNIADAHISALLLAGQVKDAVEVAQWVREQAADLPGAALLLAPAVQGRAALGAGRVDSARALLGEAVAGLSASGHAIGWGYRYSIPRATALAMCGAPGEAAAGLEELAILRRPFRSLDYERSVARAWVAAGSGAVSEAVTILLAAAEKARAVGQFAAEVVCLQIAAQFGASTCAARLRELELIVEGPRVVLAARLATGLRDDDATELALVSEEFERMGDVVAAVDAAAHAALAHRRHGRRGSALKCSARARALAEECGGLSTPSLRQAVEPLPLTDREREIVMLIGQGLSNRAIAARLTLSVRTVESHIYQSMSKTGTTSRDELAALLIHPSIRP